MKSFNVNKSNIENLHQRNDAAKDFMHLCRDGFDDSLGYMLMVAISAPGVEPSKVDERTKKGKALVEARNALLDAASKYDAARKAAKE